MKQIVTCKEMKALDGNMIEGNRDSVLCPDGTGSSESRRRTGTDAGRQKTGRTDSLCLEAGTTEEMAWLLPVF